MLAKSLPTILLSFLLLPLGLWAEDGMQRKEFTKEINKVFNMERTGSVALYNRHGKVNVKVWDKPQVKVDVKIIVQAKDEQGAEAIFDRIKVDFSNENDFVKAVTNIAAAKKSGWGWTTNWGGTSTKDDFEINYEVSMPKAGKLDLRNKYGDAFVAETDGAVGVEINYGSIHLEGVNNSLSMYIGYGDATVLHAQSVTADVKYSKMRLGKANDASLTTRYSKIYVDKIDDMRTVTKYDEYEIDEVGTLRSDGKYNKFHIEKIDRLIADGRYTDYNIDYLGGEADVVVSYGGLRIEELGAGFNALRLDGSYANFRITADPSASYSVDATASYGDISLPAQFKQTYKRDSGHSSKVEGTMGSGKPGSIKVNVQYGGIKIR